MIKELSIAGFRGFSDEQKLNLGQPNGKAGSGLTVLVGPNSGGKSTVIESLEALFSRKPVEFSKGQRNEDSKKRVTLSATLADGSRNELKTADVGGSGTVRHRRGQEIHSLKCYVLPSRRLFEPRFSDGLMDRSMYISQQTVQSHRRRVNHSFPFRLFNARNNMYNFNKVLSKIMDPVPKWTIERSDEGSYYIEIDSGGKLHDSDGAGDGVVSLLFLIDALYDSERDGVIAIDEPELSLHPAYQRRLTELFAEYAKDRQLVYATHSPYFVDFEHIRNGAQIARVHRKDACSVISPLRRETINELGNLQKNINNPHILGLDARETFFRDDGVIVVEGQEDVMLYPRVLDHLGKQKRLKERFFGWGAGGAGNIGKILALLDDLGFERVAAIFDKDEEHSAKELAKKFKDYQICVIPACDVRTKEKEKGKEERKGLLDSSNSLREEFKEETEKIFDNINSFILTEN